MSDESEAAAMMEVSDKTSDPATRTTTAAKKATMKKSGVAAAGSSHPRYSDMVVATIKSFSSRTGVSRQAIIKKMKEDYDLGDNETKIANWVRITLKKGLESGLLKKAAVEGRKGAGSYKLGDQAKSSVWDKSKTKSSAKSISAGSPSKIKKPKTKKVTTPAKNVKSKTVTKSSNSKVVKKTETSKAAKTKPKKTAEAATKKQTAGAKKPATAAKKSAAATRKPAVTNKKTTTAAKKTGSTATAAKGAGVKKSGKK